MKTYIAGKITGFDKAKEVFRKKEIELIKRGYTVLNPTVLPDGFEHEEYMHICYAMIDVCETVYFLNNWNNSKGAKMELEYAITQGKRLEFQEEVSQ